MAQTNGEGDDTSRRGREISRNEGPKPRLGEKIC